MELVYVSVNGTKVAFLKNAKLRVSGRSLDVVEGTKSEGKREIGFAVPEEVERRLMVEKVFRKMHYALKGLQVDDPDKIYF